MVPISLPQPPDPDAAPKVSPYSLAAALDRLRWDPARDGVLLLVAPERIVPPSFNLNFETTLFELYLEGNVRPAFRPPPLPSPGPDGYGVERLATHFQLRPARFGNVTTLARIERPDTESLAHLELDTVDYAGNVPKLLATFTTDQWLRAGSDPGIGVADFTDRQRRLWESALPASVQFDPKVGRPPVRRRPNDAEFLQAIADPSVADAFQEPILTADQRAGLRLRARRYLDLTALSAHAPGEAADDSSRRMSFSRPEPPSYETTVWLTDGPMVGFLRSIVTVQIGRVRVVPKSSDLDPVRLTSPVALAGVATVGALTARIGAASGIELVCDRAFERHRVFVRGDAAQAGALVAALCRALDGAVRRVGGLYLVTRDRVPLARQKGLVEAVRRVRWAQTDAYVERSMGADDQHARIARSDPRRLLGKAGNEDLPESIWERALTERPAPTFPLADLPPAYQERARDLWNEMSDTVKSTELPPDRVEARVGMVVELLWPEVEGVAHLARYNPDSFAVESTPPIVWNERLPVRGLSVALPVDDAGVQRLIDVALAQRITHLFVPDGDPARLLRLTAAATGKFVVWVTHAPLHGGVGVRDVSPSGDTAREWAARREVRDRAKRLPGFGTLAERIAAADWITPESVDPNAVAARVRRLLAIPGVAGVALTDLDPPGYQQPSSGGVRWAGSATIDARAAAIRKIGIDPADLLDEDEDMRIVPLSEGNRSKIAAGNQARIDALYARLDAALRAAGLVEKIRHRGDDGWYAWSGAPERIGVDVDGFPRVGGEGVVLSWRALDLAPHGEPWLERVPSTEALRTRWAEGVSAESGDNTPYDGAILELESLPLDTALKLVDEAFARRNPPPPAVVKG